MIFLSSIVLLRFKLNFEEKIDYLKKIEFELNWIDRIEKWLKL